jgi:hypothetical protein
MALRSFRFHDAMKGIFLHATGAVSASRDRRPQQGAIAAPAPPETQNRFSPMRDERTKNVSSTGPPKDGFSTQALTVC